MAIWAGYAPSLGHIYLWLYVLYRAYINLYLCATRAASWPSLWPLQGSPICAPFIQRIQLSSWQFINSSLGQLTGYFKLFYVQLKWQIVATAYALHPTLRSLADNGSKAKPNPLWINWQCFSASGHVRGTPLSACVCESFLHNMQRATK